MRACMCVRAYMYPVLVCAVGEGGSKVVMGCLSDDAMSCEWGLVQSAVLLSSSDVLDQVVCEEKPTCRAGESGGVTRRLQ